MIDQTSQEAVLPCPLCQSTDVQPGVCYVDGSSTREDAARCGNCGCRATKRAWQARGHAQRQREPAAYLHTLHMELGQTQRKLMWTEPSPFGIPGKHYDATYTVSCTPLFAVTDSSTDREGK